MMADKKGIKRVAEDEAEGTIATALARLGDEVAVDVKKNAHNARAVLISNASKVTEHHTHHHHPITTITTTAQAPFPSSLPPWQALARALSNVECLLATTTAASQAHFTDVSSSKSSLDKARDTSDAAVVSQQAVVEAERREMSKLSIAVVTEQEKNAEMGVATEDQSACESALSSIQIIKGDAIVVKNGSVERPDDPKHVKSLMPLLQRTELKKDELQRFPLAAAKRASERSELEQATVREAESAIQAHLTMVSAKLASSSSPMAECKANLQAAEGRRTEASVGLRIAESRLSSLLGEQRKAQDALDKVVPVVEQARVEFDSAQQFLQQFRDGPLMAFRSMDEGLARQLLERATRRSTDSDARESQTPLVPNVAKQKSPPRFVIS